MKSSTGDPGFEAKTDPAELELSSGMARNGSKFGKNPALSSYLRLAKLPPNVWENIRRDPSRPPKQP